MKIEMTLTKETKNTHVYNASDERGEDLIPTVYIKKSMFGKKPPEYITVTIEEIQE